MMDVDYSINYRIAILITMLGQIVGL